MQKIAFASSLVNKSISCQDTWQREIVYGEMEMAEARGYSEGRWSIHGRDA
jgi:hypothetical protein